MLQSGLKFRGAAAIAIMLAFAVSANVQAQNRRNRNNNSNSNATSNSTAEMGHAWKASEIIGLSVHTANNEEKGKIKDLMMSGNGRVEYAVVSFGGFLGMGDKLFAVPLDAIHLEWKDDKINYATVDVSEDSIKQRQGFDEKNWPEHADRGFMTSAGNKVGTRDRTRTTTGT
jgi:PRC-barrel domain